MSPGGQLNENCTRCHLCMDDRPWGATGNGSETSHRQQTRNERCSRTERIQASPGTYLVDERAGDYYTGVEEQVAECCAGAGGPCPGACDAEAAGAAGPGAGGGAARRPASPGRRARTAGTDCTSALGCRSVRPATTKRNNKRLKISS